MAARTTGTLPRWVWAANEPVTMAAARAGRLRCTAATGTQNRKQSSGSTVTHGFQRSTSFPAPWLWTITATAAATMAANASPATRRAAAIAATVESALTAATRTITPAGPASRSAGAPIHNSRGPGWSQPNREYGPISGVLALPTSCIRTINMAWSPDGVQPLAAARTMTTRWGTTATAASAATTRDEAGPRTRR